MSKLLLFGMLLLFSVVVAADSTWEAGDEMITERTNDINRWVVNPCIDQNIQVNESINLKVFPLSCAYVKTSGIFTGTQYRLRCDDMAIKLSVWDPTTTLVFDTGWTDIHRLVECVLSSRCDIDDSRGIYFWDTSYPMGLYGDYIEFGKTMADGGVRYFAYVPPFDTANESGHLNATFQVNKTGNYVMKVYLKDTQNSSIAIDTQTINFTVVLEGVVSGQCSSTNFAGPQSTENPVTGIFGSWNVIVWFLLMIIVGVGILIVSKSNMKVGVGIAIFAELIMLLMGTWLHIISPVYLLILGLLLIVVVTIAIRKVFFS